MITGNNDPLAVNHQQTIGNMLDDGLILLPFGGDSGKEARILDYHSGLGRRNRQQPFLSSTKGIRLTVIDIDRPDNLAVGD